MEYCQYANWLYYYLLCHTYVVITAHKQSLRRLCFYTCLSVHGERWGGIPACLAAGLEGLVSQHALQVSRPAPRGEVEGSGLGGFTRPTPWGGSPGPHLGVSRPTSRGVSRPTPSGVSRPSSRGSPGPHPGGLQAHTQGGVSQHALRQTPSMGTAAGSTHPTGMHSCLLVCSQQSENFFFIFNLVL